MFYDLLAMDLSGFDVRAIPQTAAKAQQQTYSLSGPNAWLLQALQEGGIETGNGFQWWDRDGLTISKDCAYHSYKDFSKGQRHYRPATLSDWSKKIRKALGPCITDTRPSVGDARQRSFKLAPLLECRRRFAIHIGASNIEWEHDRLPAGEIGAPPGRD